MPTQIGTHLDLIHEKVVHSFRLIMFLHISMERVIFFEFFICQIHKINKNDIDIFKMTFLRRYSVLTILFIFSLAFKK